MWCDRLGHPQRPLLVYASLCVAGALLTFSFAPVSWWGLILLGVPHLLNVLRQSNGSRSAFFIGGSFGFGCYSASMYWISFSFGVDLEAFAWLIPFTVFGLPLFFAVFPGLAAALTYSSSKDQPMWFFALNFALLWTIMEYARSVALTGFPWSLIGYVWSDVIVLMQVTSLVGIYGLSFLTLLWASLPVVLLYNQGWRLRSNQIYSFIILLTLSGAIIFGLNRLNSSEPSNVDGVMLRLVQPNIPQKIKMDRSRVLEIYELLLDLSLTESTHKITHVIWPEAALPQDIQNDPVARKYVALAAPENGYLLMGATRYTGQGESYRIFNSFFVLDAQGTIKAIYDKSHLVPFGEYVPLRSLFPKGFKKLTLGSIDFSEGSGVQSIKTPGAPPLSALICYEIIFPGNVMPQSAAVRPEWMLNITNDAWFGKTFGPYQHFSIAKTRAIEEGVPLIRVANTGISGVIDSYGRVLHVLDLNQRGIIDAPLPKALQEITFYARYGYLLLPFLILWYGVMVLGAAYKKRRPALS